MLAMLAKPARGSARGPFLPCPSLRAAVHANAWATGRRDACGAGSADSGWSLWPIVCQESRHPAESVRSETVLWGLLRRGLCSQIVITCNVHDPRVGHFSRAEVGQFWRAAKGVKPKTAWRRVYEGNKSLWALSIASATERALRNAYFAERGLVSLEQLWRVDPRRVVAPVQLTLGLG